MLLTAWLTTQAWWLYKAYQLEFQGKNTFFQIWFASILFGLTNVVILCMVMYNYRQIVTVSMSSEKAAKAKKE